MQLLNDLITAAMNLAGNEGKVSHANRLWKSVGGRSCPIGWEDCSQTVYIDLVSDAYDYGEKGGPGHADCERHCPHGRQAAPDEDTSWDGVLVAPLAQDLQDGHAQA